MLNLFDIIKSNLDVESNHLEDLIKTNNGLNFVNLKANISREEAQVYLTSPELIACFQKSAKDYEKMKTDHSEAICNRLIPYKTKGIREIDQIIRWKYYDVEELNIKFCDYSK
ncbi:unnamed protein product [Schistosoma margrebowiei]|uniref:Uncharacterized protein n=1 Tax=Schistosoma margrebowiei TaxID=48269 RepID=A0AA84ZTP4_9TREM|nr:unnamed protein product [Schistosoma margrebowiei]